MKLLLELLLLEFVRNDYFWCNLEICRIILIQHGLISRHKGTNIWKSKTAGAWCVNLKRSWGNVKLRTWFTFIRDNGGMNEQTTKVNLTSEYPNGVCSLYGWYLAWHNESIPREENCVHYITNRISRDNEIWKLTIPRWQIEFLISADQKLLNCFFYLPASSLFNTTTLYLSGTVANKLSR